MVRPTRETEGAATVTVAARLTTHQSNVLDALMKHVGKPAGASRGGYLVELVKAEYKKQVTYGGMEHVEREQGGADEH